MNYLTAYGMMSKRAAGYGPEAPAAPEAPMAPEGAGMMPDISPMEIQGAEVPDAAGGKPAKPQLAPELLQMYPFLAPDSAIGKMINPADRKLMEQYALCLQELMVSQDPNSQAYMQNIMDKIQNIYDKAMRAL